MNAMNTVDTTAKNLDAEIGSRLRALRQSEGLTLAGLSSRIGISSQQLQKYEAGINRISAARLYAMAGELGCDVTEFFPENRDDDEASGRFDPETLHLARMLQKMPRNDARAKLIALVETMQQA